MALYEPSQRALADTIGIDRATVVALLDDLHDGGGSRAHALMEEWEQRFVSALTPAQRRQLQELLAGLLSRSSSASRSRSMSR